LSDRPAASLARQPMENLKIFEINQFLAHFSTFEIFLKYSTIFDILATLGVFGAHFGPFITFLTLFTSFGNLFNFLRISFGIFTSLQAITPIYSKPKNANLNLNFLKTFFKR
jgi:hypothetical protein